MQRLLAIVLMVASSCVFAKPESVGDFVETYAKAHDFSGVVLVRRDGEELVHKAFGEANRAFHVANTKDTRFWIASITKAFTAVLVMQLHEQGKLELDATIGKYLPDYRGNGRDKVTLHQLLNHTSGLPNFDTVTDVGVALAKGIPYYQLPHTSDELLTQYCSGDLVHEPGTTFDYNNGDYIVLGKIIERITGESFDDVLHARILEPLALRDTGLLYQRDVIERLAATYFYRDDIKALAPDLPAYPENWYAAGAMYSTAADLATFADELFAGKLIGPTSLEKLTEPGLDDYGYGVWSYDTTIDGKSYHVVKRPGRIMGAQTQLFRIIDPAVTIVILANTSSADLDAFAAEISKRVVRDRQAANESDQAASD